jgi:hypothetical protein
MRRCAIPNSFSAAEALDPSATTLEWYFAHSPIGTSIADLVNFETWLELRFVNATNLNPRRSMILSNLRMVGLPPRGNSECDLRHRLSPTKRILVSIFSVMSASNCQNL